MDINGAVVVPVSTGKVDKRRQHTWQHWKDFLGLFIGIVAGYQIKNQVLSQYDFDLTCHKQLAILRHKHEIEERIRLANERQASGTVYIGLMSAHKYLDTRIDAAIYTWMKRLPPNVKIEVFADNNGTLIQDLGIRQEYLSNGVRIIQLPGVSDRFYPPQKKSFSMIKFMHDMYVDKFDWFIRLDDDAYIETENVLKLLIRLNTSKPVFMGHVGFGLHDEDFLTQEDSFCMGGTGIVFSSSLLRSVAPKLQHCLTHLYTEHEDVELGRCVHRSTGANCTTSWETSEIFHQEFSTKKGHMIDFENLNLEKGLTFHPNKNPAYQRKLHLTVLKTKLRNLVTKIAQLEKEIHNIHRANIAAYHWSANSKSGVLWESLVEKSAYRNFGNLKFGFHGSWKKLFKVYEDKFRKPIFDAGTTLESVTPSFSYRGINPLFASDTISNLTVAYMYGPTKYRRFIVNYRQYFPKHVQFFYEPYAIDVGQNKQQKQRQKNQKHPKQERSTVETSFTDPNDAVVNFLMILSGRKDFFLRFLQNFEDVFLKKKEKANLIVVYFPKKGTYGENASQDPLLQNATKEVGIIEDSVKALQARYKQRVLKVINMKEVPYCKTTGLQKAKDQVKDENEILFFCDVDMIFSSPAFLWHVRQNTIQGKRTYYPVTFSEYDPSKVYKKIGKPKTHFEYREIDGFWRYYGFGMVSIYKSDFKRTRGFDLSICGWGQEDVEMANAILDAGLDIFQATNPYQVHVYHDKFCDSSIPEKRLAACRSVRALHFGPKPFLYKHHQRESEKQFESF